MITDIIPTTTIEILILIGSLLDLTLTYNYLKIYSQKFPQKDYVIIEANPLIRLLIRNSGLKEGMIQSAFIILPIILIVVYFLPSNLHYFLAGCFYMMITFHLSNFFALKRLEGVKTK